VTPDIATVTPDSPAEDRRPAWRIAHAEGAAAARRGLPEGSRYPLGSVAGAAYYNGWSSVADRRGYVRPSQLALF
jgi:hypothetical protein